MASRVGLILLNRASQSLFLDCLSCSVVATLSYLCVDFCMMENMKGPGRRVWSSAYDAVSVYKYLLVYEAYPRRLES